MKKIVLYVLLICSVFCIAQAEGEGEAETGTSSGVPENIREEMRDIFTNENDSIVEGGACSYECRQVKGGYGTQIVGYDFVNGVTFCSVFEMGEQEKPLKFNANKQNLQCQIDASSQITPAPDRSKDNDVKSTITQTLSDTEITLSRFLTGLATLDPSIIDREKTENTGQLTLTDGVKTRGSVGGLYKYGGLRGWSNSDGDGLDAGDGFLTGVLNTFTPDFLKPNKEPQPIGSGETISMADKFNKANMAYFSNLYHDMSPIYNHLQNLLFVVVGGFFIGGMGFRKLQAYLENKGQGTGRNEPYLHKFLIPMIAVGTFYMPIYETKDMSATVVQKLIRYFTAQANNIADLASATGGATYMNKLFSSVGGITQEGENILRVQLSQARFTYDKANLEYQRCAARYKNPYGIPYSQMKEQELKELLESWDIEKAAGGKDDISFQTCVYLERVIWDANAKQKELGRTIKAINKYYANNELQTRLKAIDQYTANREKEYGWINSILLPGTGLMVELQSFVTENAIQQPNELESSAEKSRVANQDSITQGEVVDGLKNGNSLSDELIAHIMGKLVYFIIPGAGSIYEFMKDAIDKLITVVASFIGGKTGGIFGGVIGAAIGSIIGKIGGPIGSFYATAFIIDKVLSWVPVLTATVAGTIVFVGYLVSLIKYFYISPFVVAFALTTKRMDKIVNFLVSGITIFFKPVLIVLFIYLALFLHTIIDELFIVFSVEQFGAIKVSGYDFLAIFGISGIQALLKIFGVLASTYVMWKTIINGPDWTFKFIGLDKDTDNIVSQGLAQRLEQRSFMA